MCACVSVCTCVYVCVCLSIYVCACLCVWLSLSSPPCTTPKLLNNSHVLFRYCLSLPIARKYHGFKPQCGLNNRILLFDYIGCKNSELRMCGRFSTFKKLWGRSHLIRQSGAGQVYVPNTWEAEAFVYLCHHGHLALSIYAKICLNPPCLWEQLSSWIIDYIDVLFVTWRTKKYSAISRWGHFLR